uniref:FH2 domain-containing protein n=1 Tax=Globodera pallida TaxID=36090 RepID=A0A183C669_GLOPA
MDDAAQDDSRTVTIALDSPSRDEKSDAQEQLITSEEQQNGKVVDFLTICPPPSPSDLLSVWRNNGIEMSAVRVRHLRADMAQLLELRLNPPSCGSMRNWEFVAAHLGLDIEEIVQMRRTKSPMCALIHRFGDEPLHKLLKLIGEAGRIDVLISVRHFATNPMATECRHRLARMDSALISASDSISSSTAFARSVSAIDVHQQQRFILILHHENAKNRDLKKFHRLLIKNLEIYAKEEGIKVS